MATHTFDENATVFTSESQLNVFQWTRSGWQYSPCGDFSAFYITVDAAPNAFHRFRQRIFFGVKWRKARG